ncbi:hypothetical protein NLJ89_g1468 [Agrocybe chaxingu]|uniref:Steroid 5-alpha reductase C-terminal domain-containing protein n=1 Tax=Agrocybe chaxingu TaxID=84603 RepID=A0A9W8TDA7_9AGAR|nr:hypothetical protein NLJ89_g1468 [Agrocybe chaxingu]
MAVFSRLLPTIASAYVGQAIFAAIFVPQQNEKFYDFCGAIGWATTTVLSLYYPSLKAKFWDGLPGPLPPPMSFAPRQVLLSAAIGLWTLRLGSFLTMRAMKAGGDSRFDEIKKRPAKFTFFWIAQATWITLVGLPVFLVNALPKQAHTPLGPRDYLALALYASSFLVEVTADNQKTAWRKAKANKLHDEQFISSGLWAISRHPNYVGEVGIWAGIWLLSTGSLQTAAYPCGTVALAALSPLFTLYLLRCVSGVPPLERAGNMKFGTNPKWQQYKNSVPIFWPWGSTK